MILFEGAASDTEDDNASLTASLAWTSDLDGPIGTGGSFSAILTDGQHTITASAIDSGGKTDNASVTITVGTVSEATTVSVASITYSTSGGRAGDKHLNITISLVDGDGLAVGGASVSIDLDHNDSLYASGTGSTGEGGTVTFTAKNAPSGCYDVEVTDVTAAGWDDSYPANSFEKGGPC